MNNSIWDSDEPNCNAIIDIIDHFSAHGMKRVYGRGDKFPNQSAFNMDIWKDKNNHLFMRFWSRGSDVDTESYEIFGINIDDLSISKEKVRLSEDRIPKEVRDAYDNWMIAYMKFNTY